MSTIIVMTVHDCITITNHYQTSTSAHRLDGLSQGAAEPAAPEDAGAWQVRCVFQQRATGCWLGTFMRFMAMNCLGIVHNQGSTGCASSKSHDEKATTWDTRIRTHEGHGNTRCQWANLDKSHAFAMLG